MNRSELLNALNLIEGDIPSVNYRIPPPRIFDPRRQYGSYATIPAELIADKEFLAATIFEMDIQIASHIPEKYRASIVWNVFLPSALPTDDPAYLYAGFITWKTVLTPPAEFRTHY